VEDGGGDGNAHGLGRASRMKGMYIVKLLSILYLVARSKHGIYSTLNVLRGVLNDQVSWETQDREIGYEHVSPSGHMLTCPPRTLRYISASVSLTFLLCQGIRPDCVISSWNSWKSCPRLSLGVNMTPTKGRPELHQKMSEQQDLQVEVEIVGEIEAGRRCTVPKVKPCLFSGTTPHPTQLQSSISCPFSNPNLKFGL
jgi:hypothetical protein